MQPDQDLAAGTGQGGSAKTENALSAHSIFAAPHAAAQDDEFPLPSGGAGGLLDHTGSGAVPCASPAAEQSAGPNDSDTEQAGAQPIASLKLGRAHKAAAEDEAAAKAGGPFDPALSALPGDAGTRGDQGAQLPPTGAGPGELVALAGQKAGQNGSDIETSPGSDISPAAPPQAAAQLGHAVAAVHTAQDGSSQIRILLNPAELGSVQVRITRSRDGASSVSVAVERPETLRSLQNDLSHLHQALDRAGLSEQRSVVLHLAAADATQGSFHGAPGGFGENGSAQGGSHRNPNQDDPRVPQHGRGVRTGDIVQAEAAGGWAADKWHRAGVNITA